jgi:hypothetical protein
MKITVLVDVDPAAPFAFAVLTETERHKGTYAAPPTPGAKRYAVTFEAPHPTDAEPAAAMDVTEVKP